MFIYIALFCISLVLYLEAPDKYSLPFCSTVFILFALSVFVFLRSTFKNKNYFNFHLFFLLSIFFTNFAYPIFIYPSDPEYFSIFTYAFDHNLISKGTALSQMAVISYIFGAAIIIRFRKYKNTTYVLDYSFSPMLIKVLLGLNIIFTLVFVGHVFYMVNVFPDEEILNTQIVNICVIIFTIALLLNNMDVKNKIANDTRFFLKRNLLIIICAAVIVLFSIWFGDRGPAIQMFFILMFVYVRYVNKLKLRYLVPLVVFGLFIMTMISYTRGGDNNLKSGSLSGTIDAASKEMGAFGSFWNYGMDLIVNNRNLYVAMELGERRELLYGKSYFAYLTSPVPGLPTILTKAVFGKMPEDFATSNIITKYTGLEWGVGSNAVGDIFMNFGSPGVMIIFFFFGLFITKLEETKSVYGLLAFTLIFALAIYYPRSSLFEQLSLVVRGIMILWIIFKVSNNPTNLKKIKIIR